MVRIVSLSFLTPRTCYTETNIVAEHVKCLTHLCDVPMCVCVCMCVCVFERERKDRVREMLCIYYMYAIIYLVLCSYIYIVFCKKTLYFTLHCLFVLCVVFLLIN